VLDNHRLSLHRGVPARQARDLSAGSDTVGRLAGADELPAANRRLGKASFRDLAGRSTCCELNAKPGPDPRLADAGSWPADQLRFPMASDTVTWTRSLV